MRIVVGGASSVGKSIVGYLSLGNNDIVVVDENKLLLDEISKEFDVQPIQGSISHPDVQEMAEMKNADMLIAVTDVDEVNLIACQVAHTLFNVEKKIARVDSEFFLNPLWNTLYNEKSLPVDLVITPDVEIAEFIYNIFKLPGCLSYYSFFKNKINIFSFRLKDTDIPFMKFSINHINNKLSELFAKIVFIQRGNRWIIPRSDELFLQRNDIVYISCTKERNIEVMRLFSVDHNPYEKVIIFGANGISEYLSKRFENDVNIVNCSIIDNDKIKTMKLAENLNRIAVISGEMMSDVILEDVHFAEADSIVALTDKDKDNLLISLLASKNKDTQAISLVNSNEYNLLSSNIRNNNVIDRSVITISSILQYLRKARIDEAYSFGREIGEVWEIRLENDSINIGQKINELNIPETSSVIAVFNNDKTIYEFNDYYLNEMDKLLVFVHPSDIKRVESIFYR